MKNYIGTKLIKAQPMNRLDYNDYRGWVLPSDENGADEGYLVEYLDGNSNHPNHDGYVSWSPKKQFEDAYKETNGLTFGLALDALKAGKKVARKGWNGKGMWLVLLRVVSCSTIRYDKDALENRGDLKMQDCIGMKTAQGTMQPGWLASQPDMLAEDWVIVG